MKFVWPNQLPLAEQDPQPAPQAAKKKKAKKGGQTKAVNVGLEGFMHWTDPTTSKPVEEREDDMSSLAIGFATRMLKRVVSYQGETTPSSEVLGVKCPKLSGPD